MTFAALRLAEPILRAVTAAGYSTPTPIQVQAIPHVLAGRDLLGCAQTGTGKTAAFALPILQRLSASTTKHEAAAPTAAASHHHARRIRVLVLSPTRELAAQIGDSFRDYGRHTGLRHTVIFGGVNQNPQVRTLRGGIDILVATPGRLLDLMNQGFVHLRDVEVFVLDEADRMLDMGFIQDIRRIAQHLPQRRQTLLFSATMPLEIRKLADSLLHEPVEVRVAPVSAPADTVEQFVYHVAKGDKPSLLKQLLQQDGMERTLVFTRTKRGADKVVKHLRASGLRAEAIHGNKKQNHRERALLSFKGHQPPVLVATDIASRGIDVDAVSHVINYDVPIEPETYVHRIGRTGRAGASGIAFSFCGPAEREALRAIEKLIRQEIQVRKSSTINGAAQHGASAPAAAHSKPHAASHSKPHVSHNAAHAAHAPHHRAAQANGAAAPKPHKPHGGDSTPRQTPHHRATPTNGAPRPAQHPQASARPHGKHVHQPQQSHPSSHATAPRQPSHGGVAALHPCTTGTGSRISGSERGRSPWPKLRRPARRPGAKRRRF